jgi:hypothetical protein
MFLRRSLPRRAWWVHLFDSSAIRCRHCVALRYQQKRSWTGLREYGCFGSMSSDSSDLCRCRRKVQAEPGNIFGQFSRRFASNRCGRKTRLKIQRSLQRVPNAALWRLRRSVTKIRPLLERLSSLFVPWTVRRWYVSGTGTVGYPLGGCGYFAISTPNDYAVLEWYGGYDPDKDDFPVGKFDSYGMKTIFDHTPDPFVEPQAGVKPAAEEYRS